MIDSAALLITDNEKRRLRVYDDKTGIMITKGSAVFGHPTIGVGRALDVKGISTAESDYLLGNDIAECTGDLAGLFRDRFTSGASAARQAALIDMRFNLGADGFRGFRRMIAAIEGGDWDAAAAEALAPHWVAEVGSRRSTRDAVLMRSGEWIVST